MRRICFTAFSRAVRTAFVGRNKRNKKTKDVDRESNDEEAQDQNQSNNPHNTIDGNEYFDADVLRRDGVGEL